MSLDPDSDLPRESVGPYELIRRIGQGGMADVFLARRAGIEGFAHVCVVKTILPDHAQDASFTEMFFDEARIAVELEHPNVVRVFDLNRDEDLVYLAMEYVRGMDLLHVLIECEERGISIPYGCVLHILRETLRGLHFAHTTIGPDGKPLNLVHRDISPGNILIGLNGVVKLGDFGVARATIARRTETPGLMVGKLRYFAPELLLGGDASHQSDLFALGACFYEMVTLSPMFPPAESTIQQQLLVRDWSPEQLLERHLDLPDGVEQVLLRALAPDPAERYEDAVEFLEDVADLVHEAGVRSLDLALARFLGKLEQGAQKGSSATRGRFRGESRVYKTPDPPQYVTPSLPPEAESWATEPTRAVDRRYTFREVASGSDESTLREEGTVKTEGTPAPTADATNPAMTPPLPEPEPPAEPTVTLAEVLAGAPSPATAATTAELPTWQLEDGERVRLFTAHGALGPVPVKAVRVLSVAARVTGVELLSEGTGFWQPLAQFGAAGVSESAPPVEPFGPSSLGPLLVRCLGLGWTLELALWSEGNAVALSVVDGAVIRCAVHPALAGSGNETMRALDQAVRWSSGQALAVPAPWLEGTRGTGPWLLGTLVDVQSAAMTMTQLRSFTQHNAGRRLRLKTQGGAGVVGALVAQHERAGRLLAAGARPLRNFSADEMRLAAALVHLGLAEAV